MVRFIPLFACALALAACDAKARGFAPADYEIVDLTHALNAETLYWPTTPGAFEHRVLDYGITEKGYFHSACALPPPERGGTHVDAPIRAIALVPKK